ncbi:phenylalanine--tRNA ligase subunit beta [Clostridium oryzae]|uniref:Phenylalanine--tRNA ligase beta subunit n=1 Tax=Clostridium oryzae TaxID=1450648 RepID=A0A1V4IGD9_9CLOT|nr:phenylalanine--tRNA ligase subunit beta [Clostridium oryzae]OPJ59062.1 phenylalanine--tRNA ligase beta subunit [Clostridium oryzae]
MKVPVKWLKDYVDIDISPEELGDKLTLSGSKVEEVIISGAEIQNVVTGKILKIEPHPDAEKLVICQVEVGKDEPIQIVTGAPNMKENDIVPVALHGSTLPGGVKIKKGKLRGVLSNGMMCSSDELGIVVEHPVYGLMILPENTPIGVDIKEALGLSSAVIDFEITSNRPDCLSVLGIARETAATLNRSYKKPETGYNSDKSSNINDQLKVEVKDSLCKRYMSRMIKNVKIESSPNWMQERLTEAGVRPINNIVDITNFVMLELGQPMHAFDKRQISSNRIVVERAKDGEKFTTLDEIERNLTSDVLCIKDGETTVALAGIMGGLDSEIKEDTTEVVFESACFDGTNIRVSAQRLALRTEASSRYEKDLDPNLAEMALNRACNLVEQLNAGIIVDGTIDVYENPVTAKKLEVDANWINKFLGTDMSFTDMKAYLERLELPTEVIGDKLSITVPTFRTDINIKEDVAEEVARIFGYDKIPTTLMSSNSLKGGKNERQKTDDTVIARLIASGLNQSISYAFISPKAFDKINLPEDSVLRNTVKIRNPLGEDYSVMRTTTAASMMENMARNYSRSNAEAYLFEIGRVYIPVEGKELPNEKNILTVGMYGDVEYVNLKGVVENLLDILGIDFVKYERETDNAVYHPGKTAALMIRNEKAGVFGEVHPDVCDNYGIDVPVFLAELNLDILYRHANMNRKYTPLPKYPAVSRDMALLIDDSILVQDIEEIIKKQGGSLMEGYKLFDIYKGKQIPDGKKSVAYSITYRANKTLTDDEVTKVHNKILKTCEYKLGAQLR